MATEAQQKAREHYETRRERRPVQQWLDAKNQLAWAAPKGAKGAIPVRGGS